MTGLRIKNSTRAGTGVCWAGWLDCTLLIIGESFFRCFVGCYKHFHFFLHTSTHQKADSHPSEGMAGEMDGKKIKKVTETHFFAFCSFWRVQIEVARTIKILELTFTISCLC